MGFLCNLKEDKKLPAAWGWGEAKNNTAAINGERK